MIARPIVLDADDVEAMLESLYRLADAVGVLPGCQDAAGFTQAMVQHLAAKHDLQEAF